MSRQGSESLKFEVRDGIARVRLNRPHCLNSLDEPMFRELQRAATRCATDPDVRVVLLTGAGTSFCSGADLKVFHAQGDALRAYVTDMATEFHVAISRFARMDAVVVAAVQGAAAGAGMSLACAADLVIAAEGARFSMAYSGVGLTPDGSSSYFLPRLVGFRRALELMVSNRELNAAEALAWGIVTEVVPDAELVARAESVAAGLAAGPARSYAGIKKLLHEGWRESLESQMEREVRTIADVTHTADAREGIAAFVEKRPPKFGA